MRPRFAFILGFAFLIFLADFFHLFETQELGFLDLRFRFRGGRRPDPRLVVIEIDDACVSRLGQWPWPRAYHAKLLNVLHSYKPQIIFYDVLFTEAGPNPKEDAELAAAIQKAGNVILPFFFHSEEPFLAFFPLAPFREAAQELGYVNIFPDEDGRIRRIRTAIHPREGSFYHTSAAAALAGFSDKEERHRWLNRIPVDRERSFWVNYPGKFSTFQRIPFYRVIENEDKEDPELRNLLQGKIVLVGETATGGVDLWPTPFSSLYPGVGIQASALHTLLQGQYLRRSGWPFSFGILMGSALLVWFLTRKNSPRVGLALICILTGLYLAWNFLVFNFLGWILPVFSVLAVMIGVYVLTLFLQYVQIRFEGELLTRELSLAARIQENFLPQSSPQVEGVELGFRCRFAREVGGDLYDWVSLGNGRIGICVGDVSGKGVPAALYMARAISEFRALAKDFNSTSALMEALNNRLVSASGEVIFVTLLYLILDLDSKAIFLSNAGHEPVLFYRRRTRQSEWIRRASAQPLGLFPKTRYPEETLSLEEDDWMVLISDGVKELRNPKGEEFGLERLEKALDSFPLDSADSVVKRLFQRMDQFSKGRAAHDDRTVLCIKFGKGGEGCEDSSQ